MNDIMISSGETLQRSDELLTAVVNDELLMMSVEHGKYFNLNVVGTRIWELLETPTTLEELIAVLTDEYDAGPDIVRREVERFINALRDRGLLARSDVGSA